jgi:hypothetical protein
LDIQGKDPAGHTMAERMYLIVGDTAERARERVLEGLD